MLLRPLSSVEKVIWRLSEVAPLNFTMITRIHGPLELSQLRAALDHIRMRHPYLRVRIQLENGEPVFWEDQVGPLSLRSVETSEEEWLAYVEQEINVAIPWRTGPLVRCVHLQHGPNRHHLLVTFHHAIGDATSGALMVLEILTVAGGECLEPINVQPGTISGTLPIDNRLPAYAHGWRGAVRQGRLACRFALQDLRFGRPAQLRADSEVPPQERWIRVYAREFDEAFTSELVQRARQERTTVHGALSAALCQTVANEIAGEGSVSIKHRSPVNVRDQLVPAAEGEIGLFASMMFFRSCITCREDFWELSRRIRSQFVADLEAGTPLIMVRLLQQLYRLLGGDRRSHNELGDRWRKSTPSTSGLTNLGRLKLETRYGPLEIKTLHFAVAPSMLGDFTATASSLGGKLNWNFLLPEPTIQSPRALQVVEQAVQRLEIAVREKTH